MAHPESFVPFDENAPFDPQTVLGALPEGTHIRGMFFHTIRDAYRNAGLKPPEVPALPFAMGDRRRYLDLQLEATRMIYPGMATGRALYHLGRRVYPDFSQTMIGKAIFALAGRSFTRIAQAGPRAYDASVSRGKAIVHDARDGFIHIEMRDVWDFPPFACGIWQGAMDVCDVQPTSYEHCIPGPGHHHLKVAWEPK